MTKACYWGLIGAGGLFLAAPFVARGQERGRVTTVVSGFQAAGGLALDAAGNFYPSDFSGDGQPGQPRGTVVRRITPRGNIELFTTEVLTPTGLILGRPET